MQLYTLAMLGQLEMQEQMALSYTVSLRTHWPLGILLLLLLPILLIRLPEVPAVWYDEGLNLTAARTLAETGIYALPSADELRPADPAIQTGPPLIVPLALLYQLTGPDLGAARLLVAVLSLVTLVALYALAYRLYGRLAAYLAVLVVLILPGDSTANYVMMSRQVLGEIPAILGILLGLHLLLSSRERWWKNLLAGLLFGAAITIKSQVLLVLTSALALTALIELWQSWHSWRRWALVLGTMAAVYAGDTGWRAWMAGSAWVDNLATLSQGTLIHILTFRPLQNLSQAGIQIRLGGGLALIALALLAQRQQPDGVPQGANRRVQWFLAIFTALWLLWYALVSIGWQRYSFVGVVFTGFFGGYLLAHLLAHIASNRHIYVALTAAVAAVVSAQHLPTLLNDTSGRDFFTMSRYLETTLTPDDRVITWEWPARYMAALPYIYPETAVANIITRDLFIEHTDVYDVGQYNALAECPNYLLLGSFTVDRYVLAEAHEAAETRPVFNQGVYELYRIPDSHLERRADGTCALNRSSLRAK